MAGHSWGAVVSCAVAEAAPERLAGLVLLDGALFDPEEGRQTTPENPLQAELEWFRALRWDSVDAYVAWARAGAKRWSPELERIERGWIREEAGRAVPPMDEATVEAMVRGMDAYAVRPAHRAIGRSGVPTLVLLADERPPELGVAFARAVDRLRAAVPQADIRTVPGTTHEIVVDAGPELGETLAAWLELAVRA